MNKKIISIFLACTFFAQISNCWWWTGTEDSTQSTQQSNQSLPNLEKQNSTSKFTPEQESELKAFADRFKNLQKSPEDTRFQKCDKILSDMFFRSIRPQVNPSFQQQSREVLDKQLADAGCDQNIKDLAKAILNASCARGALVASFMDSKSKSLIQVQEELLQRFGSEKNPQELDPKAQEFMEEYLKSQGLTNKEISIIEISKNLQNSAKNNSAKK